MNEVILSGRLTNDPDVRTTSTGKTVATYTLAVNRRGTEQKADFIRCQAWEKRAEFAQKYLHKGTKIIVTGRIQTGDYTDKDGKKVYTTDVIVENHEFCESKKEEKTEFMSASSVEEDLPFA